jgi:hypothetical protein
MWKEIKVKLTKLSLVIGMKLELRIAHVLWNRMVSLHIWIGLC